MLEDQVPSVAYTFVRRSRCPVCGGKDGKSLFKCRFNEGAIGAAIRQHYAIDPRVLGDNIYHLVRCGNCSLVYQRWVGDDRLLADLYCDWVRGHALPEEDPVYQKNVRQPRASRDGHELMVAARFLQVPLQSLRTLDFGMGWGLWARIASQLGCQSYGAELAPERIDYARRYGVVPVELDELRAHQFHFINTEQVFEHLTEPLAIGKRLAEALIPGGILKISVPLGTKAPAIASRLHTDNTSVDFDALMPVAPLEHVNSFNHEAIEAFAERLGLSVVRPSWSARFAFLGVPGAVSLREPKSTLKEIVRPFWQVLNRRNLYAWLQKPMEADATAKLSS